MAKVLGVALIAEGGLALQAEGLARSDLYSVWLVNTRTDALPLGYAQYDRRTKRLSGAIQSLPPEAARYTGVVVARQPGRGLDDLGRIVLRGRLKR